MYVCVCVYMYVYVCVYVCMCVYDAYYNTRSGVIGLLLLSLSSYYYYCLHFLCANFILNFNILDV